MNNRSVVALLASMFITSISIGITNPVVPLYAKKLGASYTDLGLIGVAASAPYCMLPVLAGLWSERIGRLKSVMVGIVINATATLFFLFSNSPLHLALVKMLQGFGLSFLWAPAEAYISDVTSEGNRTKYLGFFNTSWSLGLFVGPILCALTIDQVGYSGVFISSFIVGFLSLLVLTLAKENVKVRHVARRVGLRAVKDMVTIGLHLYVVAVALSVVLAIIYSIYPAYLSILNFSDSEVSLIIGTLAVARAIGFWSSSIMYKLNERIVVTLCLLLQIISSILLAGARNTIQVLVLITMAGYVAGVQTTFVTSMISKLSSSEFGLSLGIMEAMFGVGWVLGPGVGGFLADYLLWDEAPYLFMASISVASLILFILVRDGKS